MSKIPRVARVGGLPSIRRYRGLRPPIFCAVHSALSVVRCLIRRVRSSFMNEAAWAGRGPRTAGDGK
jgi:hypothetical protein